LKLVIKLSGTLFPMKLNPAKISAYAGLLRRLKKKGHKIVVVTGGGEDARRMLQAARELGGSETLCDMIGIETARLNSRLLIAKLGEDAYPEPPTSVGELRRAFELGKIVIMGGLQPGQSTDAVAAIAAESIGADILIRTTDVDGVYTSDPAKDPNAKKLDRIEVNRLLKKVLSGEFVAGSYELFDPIAVKVVARSGIRTWIINVDNPRNVESVIQGKSVGTLVDPAKKGKGKDD
jgi:uridylate kinase